MEIQGEPILEITWEGGSKAFSSLDEISAFFQNEQSYWSWAAGSSEDDIVNQYVRNIMRSFSDIQTYINNARGSSSEEDIKNAVEQIKSLSHTIFYNFKLPQSSSLKAKFIEARNPQLAKAYALAYFLGITNTIQLNMYVQQSYSLLLSSTIEAAFVDKGLISNIEEERQALNSLKEEYSTIFENDRIKLEALNVSSTDLKRAIEELHKQQIDTYNERLSQMNLEFAELKTNSLKELEAVRQTYDQKLALQSSISYWGSKVKNHKWMSIGFGLSALAGGIAIGSFTFSQLHSFLGTLTDILKGNNPDTTKLLIGYSVATAIPVFLGFWGLKLLVRIFLSHVHLFTDAKERTTMIQTYLALLREGNGLADGDKKIILETLFRPSSTGIIKDDGVPQHPIVEIFKNYKPGSGGSAG
jgi:hypothetical protein